MLIDCVVGTRPNFVKMAPILRAFAARPGVATRLVHTGQHYDEAMDRVLFDELGLPRPDVNLAVGPAPSGPEQAARMMAALAPLMRERRPDLVVVVGDVNSTLAAALTASGLKIPLAHVEAGLRSFDRAMPEELNRMVVDQLADLHFVTEQAGVDNLLAERIAAERIHFVGNVMIDSLFACRERAVPIATVFAEAGADADFVAAARDGFGFVTMHRPSNVDDGAKLAGLLDALVRISERLPLIFAVHPRTAAAIERFGLGGRLAAPRLLVTGPLSYLRAVGAMSAATVVLTDSGGLQEEATALGTACLTIRDNTERPSTLGEGVNRLAGSDPAALEAATHDLLDRGAPSGRLPPLWDGRAAERIADVVMAWGASRG
ncbi:non-hydrolyzing UDP-N-acetylglucosamine 2-epimerase [Oharaeibacter diazotrophicus]|uniref:UDP-N-acetylglucosamine 2-epimerase (Non-hydrolysing) n=1 Tax=Oharaeibacter diazotrophicus TaxID=1920512 RepID=A0A4R6R8H6_9HYPH|nr:UDP-N-acetylglucosamine 2-epimerase (non-hydrolyzing) [Oharaeibacter diazotrophicus]TDP82323.1 UDP-N-acetylglucosamine 2-epimerase (non-hydrolysing) [Oharaeibacter diazotrophicus]BBE72914.1 UDP-2,3-diacetamido-2,3-dideoxy-D-glucuronate 2-epimerase [Pleomorphomonas sp. SM30]GLS76952.1 UDP-N-acetylglucosamine 2-epimerase (non-hydrolyzing) [Oharaeibacter diazotrophicus]